MSDALRIARGRFGRVALLDMDRPLVRHAHPHCHVLLKVEGVDTQFLVRGRKAPLCDESAVLINAWEPHSYDHYPGQPKTIILALYIEPHWLGDFRKNWAAGHAPDFFETNVGSITPEIHELTHTLAAVMVHAPDETRLHEELLGKLMIAVIERFTAWRSFPHSIRDLAAPGALDYRIRKAVDLIRYEPDAVADMDELARSVGLSRAHFFRMFESGMGVTPKVFINVQRVERAIAAVADSDETLASIGERLGFSVPAHFSRFFHDHVGSSPSVFRNVSRLKGRI
ncbi:AraC family transcriptional regulator (plasmid) [Phyllobacteriaceae bacterium JZ32]